VSRAPLVVAGLVYAASLAPVWALPYFPGQDTPNHLYAVHVRARLEEPAFAAYFEADDRATTNVGFHGVAGALEGVVGLEGGHRLVLSIYLLGFLAGALYLAGAKGRERWPLGLLVYPFAFSWPLTMGFYNFCLTVPLWCFATGLLLRHAALRWPHLAALAALALAAALFHPLGVLCIAVSALVTPAGMRSRMSSLLAVVPAIALVLLGAGVAVAGPLDWPGGFPSPLYVIATSFYRFALPLGPGEAPAAGAAYFLLLVPALHAAWRARGEASDPARRLALVFVLLLFLLPERSFGRDHISTRFAVFLALLAPVFGSYGWLLVRPRLLHAVPLVLSLAATALFALGARAVNDDLAEYAAGTPAVARGATLLPLCFDAQGAARVTWPLLHAWGYYGTERDAIVPYVFNVRPEQAGGRLRLRHRTAALPAPGEQLPGLLASGVLCAGDAACAARFYEALAREACAYDQVLTWVAPVPMAVALGGCFEPAFRRGRLAIYRKRSPSTASPALRPSSGRTAPEGAPRASPPPRSW
jgi:hypothetical protein